MERAGYAAARLALALWPQARRVSLLCGPGNNGGDGLVMARHLHLQGLGVDVVQVGLSERAPVDRVAAERMARQAGVPMRAGLDADASADLVVDALLGIGLRQAPHGALAGALQRLAGHPAPRLALDLPSGLDADQGCDWGAVRCTHTLSFLGAKPGLLTGAGRELCGRLWLDDLDVSLPDAGSACARGSLAGWLAYAPRVLRPQGAHKGHAGQVLVLAGVASMAGAARLAARAALGAGAGRVYLVGAQGDPAQPELMTPPDEAALALLPKAAAVAGCGGGSAVAVSLPQWLSAAQLVLDADALNAIAVSPALAQRVRERERAGLRTVLTPHPLEAARLLGLADAAAVQAARLTQAQRLAERFACTVVLKGSGSVIASPGQAPCINTTGHAALSTAGTGDVLAGWLAGLMAQAPCAPLHELAALACAWHGLAAERAAPGSGPLRASLLVEAMVALHP